MLCVVHFLFYFLFLDLASKLIERLRRRISHCFRLLPHLLLFKDKQHQQQQQHVTTTTTSYYNKVPLSSINKQWTLYLLLPLVTSLDRRRCRRQRRPITTKTTTTSAAVVAMATPSSRLMIAVATPSSRVMIAVAAVLSLHRHHRYQHLKIRTPARPLLRLIPPSITKNW